MFGRTGRASVCVTKGGVLVHSYEPDCFETCTLHVCHALFWILEALPDCAAWFDAGSLKKLDRFPSVFSDQLDGPSDFNHQRKYPKMPQELWRSPHTWGHWRFLWRKRGTTHGGLRWLVASNNKYPKLLTSWSHHDDISWYIENIYNDKRRLALYDMSYSLI